MSENNWWLIINSDRCGTQQVQGLVKGGNYIINHGDASSLAAVVVIAFAHCTGAGLERVDGYKRRHNTINRNELFPAKGVKMESGVGFCMKSDTVCCESSEQSQILTNYTTDMDDYQSLATRLQL